MKKNEIPRGLRNNNPGNIRINSDLFQGEVRPSKDKSFKQFETMAYGYRAIFKILRSYYNNYHLDTIRKMITRWAPPKENHTEKYIQFVSGYAGIPADDLINVNNRELMIRIAAGMSRMENGRDADMSDVIAGWNLL
ncbi:structural protein P5 [Parabacteroides goldsteinii]|uniref:structural protein P5 n=1 Tax=Parabacteroides goldsteinii TaxID=328812 RepID=UPI0032B1414A